MAKETRTIRLVTESEYKIYLKGEGDAFDYHSTIRRAVRPTKVQIAEELGVKRLDVAAIVKSKDYHTNYVVPMSVLDEYQVSSELDEEEESLDE